MHPENDHVLHKKRGRGRHAGPRGATMIRCAHGPQREDSFWAHSPRDKVSWGYVGRYRWRCRPDDREGRSYRADRVSGAFAGLARRDRVWWTVLCVRGRDRVWWTVLCVAGRLLLVITFKLNVLGTRLESTMGVSCYLSRCKNVTPPSLLRKNPMSVSSPAHE